MNTLGVRFVPDDRELIEYLYHHVHGHSRASYGAINEGIDPYSCHPENLPNVSVDGSSSYYYADRDARDPRRCNSDGYWRCTIGQKPIYEKRQTVGYKRQFRFHVGRNSNNSGSTKFVMDEYTLNSDSSHGTQKAICVIRTTARNRRNESTFDATNGPHSNYTNVADALRGTADYLDLDYELPPEFNSTNGPHS